MVTYKIVLDTRRSKNDGTYPLIIRVTNNRKSNTFQTGVFLLSDHWNANISQVEKSNKNWKDINHKITSFYLKIQKAILEIEREKEFTFEDLKEALSIKKNPKIVVKEKEQSISLKAKDVLQQALAIKLKSDLSKKYKRNLQDLHRHLLEFLTVEEQNKPITNLTSIRMDLFLSRYSKSGTYYMNKRRDLSVLFNLVSKIVNTPLNLIKATERRKAKAALHVAYDVEQLKPILNYLKSFNHNVYLCCLLTYSCWLRPHEEVRLLTKRHFTKDYSEIHLSGDENKSGRIRVVYVPEYVRTEIIPILNNIELDHYLFTGTDRPLNPYYFSTQWKRATENLIELKLIRTKQTLYSFRHTAAVQLYKRTKDVYLLQKLLGHSTIVVTLKYLRSLGELNSEELRNAAPILI